MSRYLYEQPLPTFLDDVAADRMSGLLSGAWCLFRLIEDGAPRPGAMLVRLVESGSDAARFTVKDVEIEWAGSDADRRIPQSIVLRSRNPAFPASRHDGERAKDLALIARLVDVLGIS